MSNHNSRVNEVVNATIFSNNITSLAPILDFNTAGVIHTDGAGTITSSSIVNGDIANSTINLSTKTTGLLPNTKGGTGVDSSGSTGIAHINAGVWTASPIVAVDITNDSITYPKLHLAGSIINTDISNLAAIAKSKLDLAGQISNADISNTAAIAYSKLNLTGSIVNADITNSTVDLTTKVTGILPNANTTAVSTNTASAIATRDGSGNFSMGQLTATNEILSNTTNQLVLGTTNTTTISSTAPAASRTLTIPDAGTNSQIVLADGNSTINGVKTFSSTATVACSTALTGDFRTTATGDIYLDVGLTGTTNSASYLLYNTVTGLTEIGKRGTQAYIRGDLTNGIQFPQSNYTLANGFLKTSSTGQITSEFLKAKDVFGSCVDTTTFKQSIMRVSVYNNGGVYNAVKLSASIGAENITTFAGNVANTYAEFGFASSYSQIPTILVTFETTTGTLVLVGVLSNTSTTGFRVNFYLLTGVAAPISSFASGDCILNVRTSGI